MCTQFLGVLFCSLVKARSCTFSWFQLPCVPCLLVEISWLHLSLTLFRKYSIKRKLPAAEWKASTWVNTDYLQQFIRNALVRTGQENKRDMQWTYNHTASQYVEKVFQI